MLSTIFLYISTGMFAITMRNSAQMFVYPRRCCVHQTVGLPADEWMDGLIDGLISMLITIPPHDLFAAFFLYMCFLLYVYCVRSYKYFFAIFIFFSSILFYFICFALF